MGLSSALQWWEEWQLRVLVLGSLCVQCYLSFFATARKKHIRPVYRFSIWLSYLGGDALAIYALATLFNRQKKVQYSSANGSHDLEVFWAPILLLHLGGQICISAYNIEDNELWSRHILTAVSQVTVALYVFCKSWSSSADKRLLAAAILLFVLGFCKCFEKAVALNMGSFSSLVNSFHPAPRTKTTNRELELEEYIQQARNFINLNEDPTTLNLDGELPPHLKQLSIPDKLFVDFAYAYADRLSKLKTFWSIDNKAAYKVIRTGISHTFNLIYTRIWKNNDQNRSTDDLGTAYSFFIWTFSLIFPIVIIGLFHSCHKEAYTDTDVKITFILLYITYMLEMSSMFTWGLLAYKWPYLVMQHNLIGSLAFNKRHSRLMGQWLKCNGLFGQYFCLKPCNSSNDITNLVRCHVKDGWMNYVRDVESYWKFNSIRGHWTFERNGCKEIIRWSIDKPFDESILLWHLATDFCFHLKGKSPNFDCVKLCRQISNYMMHLLSANPEMLLPGTRKSLFTDAYRELEGILQGEDLPLFTEKELTQKIIDKVEPKESFVHDAWILAQELMQMVDEKMWEVIKDVWIEMLCFSASRCRGYLHAKNLGFGGEYLTFVSLLMSHAGLETFVERQQRIQLWLPKEERVKIAKQRIEEATRNEAACVSVEVEVVP